MEYKIQQNKNPYNSRTYVSSQFVSETIVYPMEKAKVYFTNLRTNPSSSLTEKMIRLVQKAGIGDIDFKNQFTAIKIHFGEPGNLAYLRPNFASRLVSYLQSLGAKCYLTDSNTLYSGGRSNGVDHYQSAMLNGYNPIAVPCPIVIADGIKGGDYTAVEIGGEYCKAPKIGRAIADADIVISMNHFKGHEQAGFGGALKNLGMGCASVGGKLELHSDAQPSIHEQNCRGCRVCEKNCAHDAIHVVDKIARIDYSKCVGCGQCIAMCKFGAAGQGSDNSSDVLNCKIAEYALAVVKGKPQFHISFIMNVSPECDCWNHNDAAVVPDLGIACSTDPVALDCACADLVNKAPVISFQGTELEGIIGNSIECKDHDHDHDKFHVLHPDTNWKAGVAHGEKIGLGTRDYDLIIVK